MAPFEVTERLICFPLLSVKIGVREMAPFEVTESVAIYQEDAATMSASGLAPFEVTTRQNTGLCALYGVHKPVFCSIIIPLHNIIAKASEFT